MNVCSLTMYLLTYSVTLVSVIFKAKPTYQYRERGEMGRTDSRVRRPGGQDDMKREEKSKGPF